MENQVKTNIEVGGTILTPQLLGRLKGFQDRDNENIRLCREHIADAVCFIGKNIDSVSTDQLKKIQNLITDLSYIRDYFNDFSKP